MSPSRRPPSPEVAALRAAALGSERQLLGQAREQARLIRSGAAGELTEADVVRMARDMAAAAHTWFDPAELYDDNPLADPELQATVREAAMLIAASERRAEAELRGAWRARQEKAAGRRWRR